MQQPVWGEGYLRDVAPRSQGDKGHYGGGHDRLCQILPSTSCGNNSYGKHSKRKTRKITKKLIKVTRDPF